MIELRGRVAISPLPSSSTQWGFCLLCTILYTTGIRRHGHFGSRLEALSLEVTRSTTGRWTSGSIGTGRRAAYRFRLVRYLRAAVAECELKQRSLTENLSRNKNSTLRTLRPANVVAELVRLPLREKTDGEHGRYAGIATTTLRVAAGDPWAKSARGYSFYSET